MAKHSESPWGISSESATIIKKYDVFGETSIIIGSAVGGKNSGPRFPEDDEEVKANAILMSCSPELLDALECLIDMIDPEDSWGHADVKRARAIVAKATGQCLKGEE